jgi:signal transduction histidine kinase
MFARAEDSPAPQAVELVQLAADRVDTWSALADAADVTLEFAAPDGPARALAVPGGVEQILDNLIDNAITAAPPQTRVTVTVRRGHAQHRLMIADEGPGLSDALKARALERFWRFDRSNPGSGLGLPIASALAKASGGTLALEDSHAGGLAVTVTLPAAGGER